MATNVSCPTCGYANSSRRVTCKQCRASLENALPAEPGQAARTGGGTGGRGGLLSGRQGVTLVVGIAAGFVFGFMVALLLVFLAPPPASSPRAAAGIAMATARATAAHYAVMRNQLLTPLGALIVATRENSPRQAAVLTAFNAEADQILPVIERDISCNASLLHSAIVSTREAASRKDPASLEIQRRKLLEIR